jgi:hypothetical protein
MVHIRFTNKSKSRSTHIRFTNKSKSRSTHIARVHSESCKNLVYTTTIGKSRTCTCKASHYQPEKSCKHQILFKKKLKNLKKMKKQMRKGRSILCKGNLICGIVPSSTRVRESYVTCVTKSCIGNNSVGMGSCTCKAKFYNESVPCKHQRSLSESLKDTEGSVEYMGCI